MGTILASAIIASASEIAQDTSNVTWTSSQILGWINEAQRTIALHRPDSSVQTVSKQLVAGCKQTISGRRLVGKGVIRNMGSDGATPGNVIRLTDRNTLDAMDEGWMSAAGATTIDEFVYEDVNDPKTFYVNPPAHATTAVYVEIIEAIDPADIATTSDPIALDDIYQPAILEWVMYRVFGRDSEETPGMARASRHLQAFFQLLGVKVQMDAANSPQNRNRRKA